MANDMDKLLDAKELPQLPAVEEEVVNWDNIIRNNPKLEKTIKDPSIPDNQTVLHNGAPEAIISLLACAVILVLLVYILKNRIILRRLLAYSSVWILGIASYLWLSDIVLSTRGEVNSVLKFAFIPPLFLTFSSLILRFVHSKNN